LDILFFRKIQWQIAEKTKGFLKEIILFKKCYAIKSTNKTKVWTGSVLPRRHVLPSDNDVVPFYGGIAFFGKHLAAGGKTPA